jgi:hypothetical protein
MSHSYRLLGLNTFELIDLGDETSAAMSWGIWDHEGPIINLRLLGYGSEPKLVRLPKALLEKLYGRFADANPQGTRIVANDTFYQYAPPGLSRAEIDELEDEGKLFYPVTMDIKYARLVDPDRIPQLCEYLPELLEPETLAALASDPEIALDLMSKAYEEGVLSPIYGPRHKRWSPEWMAYVDAYKKAHPVSSG